MDPASKAHSSVLTIAGSDPSGGAGIQADLKTIILFACYGSSVITALTAQNTTGVKGVFPCPPDFVEQQMDAVLDDLEIHAIKTGMLYDAATVKAVVKCLKSHFNDSKMPPLVCDPVCVSTSGHSLLQPEAIRVIVEDLFPIAALITPNKSEAELLLSHGNFPSKIESLEDMLEAAKNLLSFGCRAALVKGGHQTTTIEDVDRIFQKHRSMSIFRYGLMEENMEILQSGGRDFLIATSELVVDVLYQSSGKFSMFVRPRIDSKNTHGTGCTLSAAIASALARGADLEEATRDGTAFTHLGIETSVWMGQGHGPLNHMHSTTFLSIPSRTPSNPYPFTRLLIKSTAKCWKEYVQHSFVRQLGEGTLPRKSFIHFIKQDYHYLKYYARAYGLMAAKETIFASIGSSAHTIQYILREIGTHKTFCKTFGISDEELEATQETSATMAYGGYLIDAGLQGDTTKLLVALMACLLGYGEVGLWLKKKAAENNSWVKTEGNPFQKWIDDYAGEDYQNAVKLGLEVLEKRIQDDPPSPSRLEDWKKVWEKCTLLEKRFWDDAITSA